MKNGERDRVAFVLALALGTVLVILAVTILWGQIAGDTSGIGEDTSRFFTLILGAVIGALATYMGRKPKPQPPST